MADNALGLIMTGRAILPVDLRSVAVASYPPCGGMIYGVLPPVATLTVVVVLRSVAQRAV